MGRSGDARGVLRVNTEWESISCLEGDPEKRPAKLRRMLALWVRAGADLGRVSEVGLLSFGVSSARVWGLALPTCVLEQDGVVSWEQLGSSLYIYYL